MAHEDHELNDRDPSAGSADESGTHNAAAPAQNVDNAPPQPAKQRRASRLQRIILDTWVPEIIAIVLSTTCLIAIAIVLRIFTGKVAPTLPYGITLNAVTATLATASRSMLIYTVAAAISQLKWCWYQKKRRLQDLQIFDDASRGPWGSITLLFSQRATSMASLGALVTVLALAFDPFVQLILTYPSRPVVSDTLQPPPLIRATDFMTAASTDAWNNALEAGIWGEPEQFYQRPGCPTGNCTWQDFRSISWCSKCRDVASNVQITNCNLTELMQNPPKASSATYVASFGHGKSLSLYRGGRKRSYYASLTLTTDAVWMLSATAKPYPSFSNATYFGILNPVVAIARLSMAYKNPQRLTTLDGIYSVGTAEECVLTLCDTDYHVLTTDGVANTNESDVNYGYIKQYEYPSPVSYYCGPNCYRNTTWATCWQASSQSKESLARIGYASHNNSLFCPRALSLWNDYETGVDNYASSIADHLSGRATLEIQDYNPNSTRNPIFGWSPNAPTYSSPVVQYVATNSLDRALSGVAASLSSLSISGATNTTAKVHGKALVNRTFVQTAWYWLVFPFALDVSGLLFLLLAIWQSRRKNVKPWKSSIFPLLYHGLEPGMLSRRPVSENVSAMEMVAEDAEVRLAFSNSRGKSMLKQT